MTSAVNQPTAFDVNSTGAGKLLSGDRLSRQTVVRDNPVRRSTSADRRISGFIAGLAHGVETAAALLELLWCPLAPVGEAPQVDTCAFPSVPILGRP